MIRYLKHAEIDKIKWDECIDFAVNGIIYVRSWYLDIVSPGWDALVQEDYKSVFPLTHRRKFCVHYLYQPFFTQQTGIFSRDHLTETLVESFIKAIPSHFRFAEINLNSMNKIDPLRYSCKPRVNLELDLIDIYENNQKKYDQNTRRNLKKAMNSGLIMSRKVEPDELITLFRENFGKKEGILGFRDYETLRKLMRNCIKRQAAITLGICSPEGRLCAGVFFLQDKSRWIFHFAASDPRARETGAMFMLVDSFIREHSGQPVILDFEGSNDQNVARFYKGFGGFEGKYYQLTLNRLPGIVRRILYFRNRFRGR